jgi:chaperonin GroEL
MKICACPCPPQCSGIEGTSLIQIQFEGKNYMPTAKTQRVAFQPVTHQSIQQGVNKIVNAIRPTLGPRPRVVAIDRILDDKMPELLDNGGVIAKRIIQLPGRYEDVGGMFIRDVLWTLHNQVGDGTATAAVLFQRIYNEGVRYLSYGGNAMQLRIALEKGMGFILKQLTEMTIPLQGQEKLTQTAESICYDPKLAKMFGEIFDIIGQYGRLEIRPGRSRDLEREYVEGMYWERGLMSREMVTNINRMRTEFEDTAILISDLDIEDPQQLLPVLEVALRAEIKSLIIVANKLSDATIGFLLANKKKEKFQVIAVNTPEYGKTEQAGALEDLAMLTGGRIFLKATGDTFAQIKAEDFGRARRGWADTKNFGIIGGKGNPRALRGHIAQLRSTYNNSDDLVLREKLLKRIGKLLGGSATLWVGGATEMNIEARVEVAKRTAAAMRGAMSEGVVPGGGVALLECRPVLQQLLDQATNTEEQAAYRILIDALAEPLRTIVTNAGYDDRDVLAELKIAGPGHGFDVRNGEITSIEEFGIYDTAVMQKTAVYAAVASAALALTIDVLVHRTDQTTHATPASAVKRKRI